MSPAIFLVLCCASFQLPGAAGGTALRVIGGRDAAPGEYPFAVMIIGDLITYYDDRNTTMWWSLCSGSALSSTWTLTALHCFFKNSNATKNTNIKTEYKYRIKYGDPHAKPSEHNNWAAILKYETLGSDDFETNGFRTHHYIDICLVYTEPVLLVKYAMISSLDYRSLYGSEVTMMGYGIMRAKNRTDYLESAANLDQPLQVMKALLRSCDVGAKLLTATICAVPSCGMDRIAYSGDSGGGVMHATRIVGVYSAGTAHFNDESIKRTLRPHVMLITPVGAVLSTYVIFGNAKQHRRRVSDICAGRDLKCSESVAKAVAFDRIQPSTPSEKTGAPNKLKESLSMTLRPGMRAANVSFDFAASGLQGKNSHLAVLTSRPRPCKAGNSDLKSLSTESGLPPMVPSSKYHMLSGDFKEEMILWIARLKINGSRGPPCCAPTCDTMTPLL